MHTSRLIQLVYKCDPEIMQSHIYPHYYYIILNTNVKYFPIHLYVMFSPIKKELLYLVHDEKKTNYFLIVRQ